MNLLHFLFREDDPATRPVAFLYECAGSRCYATEQPKGGDTPYVQMIRIFHSNNYHVELITNCRAYDYGNPTGRLPSEHSPNSRGRARPRRASEEA